MRNKSAAVCLAVFLLGSVTAFSGCSLSGPNASGTQTLSGSSEAEQKKEASGTLPALNAVSLSSRWYNAAGERLTDTTITVFDGKTQLFSGKTSQEGTLETVSVPTGKQITFFLTDASGGTIASSDLICESSSDFSENIIVPMKEADSAQTIQIAPDSNSVITAMYITEGGKIAVSSISRDLATLQAQQPAADAASEETAESSADSAEEPVESADDIIAAADAAS